MYYCECGLRPFQTRDVVLVFEIHDAPVRTHRSKYCNLFHYYYSINSNSTRLTSPMLRLFRSYTTDPISDLRVETEEEELTCISSNVTQP